MTTQEESDTSPISLQLVLDREMFVRTLKSMAIAICANAAAVALLSRPEISQQFGQGAIILWPPNLLLKADPTFAMLPAEVGTRLLQITSVTSAIWLVWLLWNLAYDLKSKSVVFISGLAKVAFVGVLICLFDALIAFRITNGNSIFTLNVKLGYTSIYIKSTALVAISYVFLRILSERIVLYIKRGG